MFDFDGLEDAEDTGESPYDSSSPAAAPPAAAALVAKPAVNGVDKAAASPVSVNGVDKVNGVAGAAAPSGTASAKEGSAAGDAQPAGGGSDSMFDFDDLETTDPAKPPSPPPTDTRDALENVDAATRKGRLLLQAAQERSKPSQDISGPGTSASASNARASRRYWKVIKTIDAGGIAVKSDGPHSNGGRLQLGSIVLEKERKGNELRYEAVSGKSWGPRTGWIKIETRGTPWVECLGSDCKEVLMPSISATAKHLKALILFDWDDTLCPTSWIEEQCPQLQNALEGQVPRHGEVWERLCEQALAVKELVEHAASLASVAFVTLAERPWVSASVQDFLPGADAVNGFEVFYAREFLVAKAPPGACPLTAMKRRAMQNAVEATIEKIGYGTTFESFISVGDSEVERKAAQDLGRECQNRGVVKYTKTVKMLEHPNVKQLTSQCKALRDRLREFVNFPGHRQITSAELLRSR